MDFIPVKDIAVNAIGGFLGGALLIWLTFGWKGLRDIRSRLERRVVAIEEVKAPSNIFSAFQLESSAEWIRQTLGHPNRIRGRSWFYAFSDGLVYMEFDESMSLRTLALGLTGKNATFQFPTIFFDCPPLGKMKLSDVLVDDLTLEHRNFRRGSEIIVSGREGSPEAWHYITFGALDSAISGALYPSEFKWDSDEDRLITPASQVDINWAAISSTSEPVTFPRDIGINLQKF